MTKAVLAVVTFLLVCSLPAMVVLAGPHGDASPVEIQQATSSSAVAEDHHEGTTSRLELSGATVSEYSTVGPDFGGAFAAEDAAMRDEATVAAVSNELRHGTDEERRETLEEAVERAADRAEALEEREMALIESYRNDELTDREFVRALAQLNRDSASLAATFDEYEAMAEEVSGYSVDPPTDLLDAFRGPVTTMFVDQIRAAGTDRQVALVTAAEGGAVVSTIDGTSYLREAIRFDNRDRSASPTLDSYSAAEEAVDERYPWIIGLGPGEFRDNILRNQAADLYQYEAMHPQGDLLAYWDIGTGNLFREIQVLSISQLPTTTVEETWEEDALELTIEETPHDGPMEINVTDTETGDPVDAEISIDDVTLGTTGDDGTLWVLPPPGSYELTATADDATVTATVGD